MPITDKGERTLNESQAADGLAAPTRSELLRLPLRTRDRYQLVEEFARGGLGRIWRVRDRELGRQLALKEILSPNPTTQTRFIREALTTARLEHPSIVTVHDAGRTDGGELFYTMNLVAGRTLEDVVADATTLTERLALLPRMLAVIEAIAYAHDQGVLHRDLKPNNIMVGSFGETTVIDWGLAKDLHHPPEEPLAESSSRGPDVEGITRLGTVVGTPAYMPPEQASGQPVDRRADIYSLGACLYFVLSGAAPYPAEEQADLLETVRTKPPQPLLERMPAVPKDLAAIVTRAMARGREGRYANAQALAQDLSRYLTGQQVLSYRYLFWERAVRWLQRHRGVAVASFVCLAVLVGGGVVAGLRESVLRVEAETERGRAERSTLSLLEQQGRSELASGHPQRAALFLAAALRQAPTDLALRFLLSQAIRPVAAARHQLVGHSKDMVSVAYSPDGRFIVSGGDDPEVRLWDAATGENVRTWKQDKGVDALTFSSDSQFVGSAGLDDKVRVFKVDGTETRTFQHNKAYRIVFTPDGTRLVVGAQDGEVEVLDVHTGALLKTLTQHTDRTQHLGLSPRGELVIGSWDRTVSIWNLETYERVKLIDGHDSAVSSVAFSHDGKWVAIAENNLAIHIRNAQTWERTHSIYMPAGTIFAAVSFSADDQTLLVTAADGVVRVWHTSSGQLLAVVDVVPEGKLFSSALSPSGDELVTGGLSGSLVVWSMKGVFDFRVLRFGTAYREAVLPSVVSKDGKRAITPTHAGTIVQWDLKTLARLRSFDVGPNPEAIATDASAGVVVSNIAFKSRSARQWNAETGATIWTADHPRLVHNIAVSADGLTYATACYDGAVRVLDALTGTLKATFPLSKERLSAVTFSPDGLEIAATDGFGRVYFVSVATGVVVQNFQAHPTWIQDIEYSPDGKRFVTAGRQDHQVRVWDRPSLERLLNLSTHVNNVMRASFSADGTLIATSGVDHHAHLFDARNGRLLRSWNGPAYSAEFTPDGKELLTTGDDGYAVLWNIEPDRRSVEQLVAVVEAASPWKLINGQLQLKRPAR
jgi:eukaryotic-like serine/threonine-protein kinase